MIPLKSSTFALCQLHPSGPGPLRPALLAHPSVEKAMHKHQGWHPHEKVLLDPGEDDGLIPPVSDVDVKSLRDEPEPLEEQAFQGRGPLG